jgi:ribonuclease T1
VTVLSRKRITAALVGLLALVLGGWLVNEVVDESGSPPQLQVVGLSTLPPEVERTHRLIEAGGPFPHEPKDGSVFGNREGLLPPREHGYYREYTVPTPGLAHRGPQRLVAGAGDELYYTADHYESFVVVDVTG